MPLTAEFRTRHGATVTLQPDGANTNGTCQGCGARTSEFIEGKARTWAQQHAETCLATPRR